MGYINIGIILICIGIVLVSAYYKWNWKFIAGVLLCFLFFFEMIIYLGL